MVAIKSRSADTFLQNSAAKVSVFLLYGTDAGLVFERSMAAIRAIGIDPRDPFQHVRLDGDEIAAEPEKLFNETCTVGLFGGPRAIRIELGARDIVPVLEPALLDSANWKVIILAGALKRDHALRRFCESRSDAASIDCNMDEAGSLEVLIDEALKRESAFLEDDARKILLSSLGADRLATRSELDKIRLYAHGRDRLTAEDVASITCDASNVVIGRAIFAAFSGEFSQLDEMISRLSAGGFDPQQVLAAGLREAIFVSRSFSARDGVESSFSRGGRTKFATPERDSPARKLNEQKAAHAISTVAQAATRARREPGLALEICVRALWSVAYLVRN